MTRKFEDLFPLYMVSEAPADSRGRADIEWVSVTTDPNRSVYQEPLFVTHIQHVNGNWTVKQGFVVLSDMMALIGGERWRGRVFKECDTFQWRNAVIELATSMGVENVSTTA